MSKSLLLSDGDFEGMPPWLASMRKAVLDCVNEDDIKEIIKSQVKLAKEGDKNAIKFVFGQVLGGDAFKNATFVQNVYNGEGGNRPDKATTALPKSEEKIRAMQRRAEAGMPLTQDEDATASDARGEDE